jgi:hypothetical protein
MSLGTVWKKDWKGSRIAIRRCYIIPSERRYWSARRNYRLNACVSLKQPICWNLVPNMMALGGWTFRGWLGHEGRGLISEICALLKEILETSLTPWTIKVHRKKTAVYNLEENLHQTWNLLLPWSWTSNLQNYEKQISVVSKPPNLWYFCYNSPNGLRQREY